MLRFAFLFVAALLLRLPGAAAAGIPTPPAAAEAAAAADTLRLTLPEAEQRFVQNNLLVLAQHYNITVAQAQGVQARLFDNPFVTVEQNALNRAVNPEHLRSANGGQVAVQAQALLSLVGRRRAAGRVADQAAVVEQLNLADLLRNLRFQLHTTFYDLFFKQQTLGTYDAEIQNLTRTVGLYQAQFEKGNVALKEVIRLRAFLFALQNERQGLLTDVAQEQADLHVLLRDESPAPYRPVVDAARLRALALTTYSEAQLADTALASRADLRARLASVRQQELNVDFQRKLRAPDVAVGYVYDKLGSYVSNYNAFTVGAAIPLFNRNQGGMQGAKAQVAGAELLAQQQRLQVQADVHQAYEQAARTDALLQSTDRDPAPFARLMTGIEQSYAKRLISVVEYLDFYESYKNNLVQLNALRASRVRAFEQLNFAVGRPLFRAE